ncbi:MAG: GNAT family N-acetyltransferase [Desulfatitalea sp.]|nr:GNAT family N-acetyltransferase [Desulfatitalea sp.]
MLHKKERSVALVQPIVKTETLESAVRLAHATRDHLTWPHPFVLPDWLACVTRHMGAPGEPLLLSVAQDSRPIGFAALAVDGETARFLGNPEVCDYQDIVCACGSAVSVMEAVTAFLSAQGVKKLDLRPLRPDAAALSALKTLAPRQVASGLPVDDVAYDVGLPADWEAYLMQLKSKQRHEVRRKMRRLDAHGPHAFRCVDPHVALQRPIEDFLTLFRRNRVDKARFMDDAMAGYFTDLMQVLARRGMLRLCFLDVADRPAAAVLCFDHGPVRYLYNSAYDKTYEPLSAGVLSILLSITHAMQTGCRRYDFLKGAETYKKRIGGQEVPLYRYRAAL